MCRPKLKIRFNKSEEDDPIIGFHTELLVDGEPLKHVTDVDFHIGVDGLVQVKLTMLPGGIDVEGGPCDLVVETISK